MHIASHRSVEHGKDSKAGKLWINVKIVSKKKINKKPIQHVIGRISSKKVNYHIL